MLINASSWGSQNTQVGLQRNQVRCICMGHELGSLVNASYRPPSTLNLIFTKVIHFHCPRINVSTAVRFQCNCDAMLWTVAGRDTKDLHPLIGSIGKS